MTVAHVLRTAPAPWKINLDKKEKEGHTGKIFGNIAKKQVVEAALKTGHACGSKF